MKSLRELSWLRKGLPVPINTVTARLNGNPDRVALADRVCDEIDIMDWLGGIRSVTATEEAVGLGRYGKTLTVLTCPSLGDDIQEEEEGEDEQSMIDRWTPRFRR